MVPLPRGSIEGPMGVIIAIVNNKGGVGKTGAAGGGEFCLSGAGQGGEWWERGGWFFALWRLRA